MAHVIEPRGFDTVSNCNAVDTEVMRRDYRIEPGRDYTVNNGRVCCIVPSYNYGHFIEQSIDSILAQTRPADEVIVVDDVSKDDTLKRLQRYGDRIRVVQNPRNLGLPATRNRAIMLTDAEFIVSIDADDYIEPTYFEVLHDALVADRTLGIAYAGVKVWVHPESRYHITANWPPEFSWDFMAQYKVPHATCIPASAMYRREMWRRAGGFNESYKRSEDVEFWLRGMNTGWNVRKVSTEPLYIWRYHGNDSNSRNGVPPDIYVWLPFMRNHQPAAGAPTGKAPVVHDYTNPLVSVIITVGPGHVQYLSPAIESVIGQTFWNWECVVVNDSGEVLNLSRYPFVKLVETYLGAAGASHARNIGIKKAAAPYVVLLDGDDFLHPFALQRFLEAYTTLNASYIYSDLYEYVDGKARLRALSNYDKTKLGVKNGITVLMRREDAQRIGFDEEMLDGWEDVDFFKRCQIAGICGERIPEPLFYYRVAAGHLRARSQKNREALDTLMEQRYGAYERKEIPMAGCCGGDQGEALLRIKNDLRGLPNLPNTLFAVQGKVKMQYLGEARGTITFLGRYPAANNDQERYIDVDPNDVKRLESTGQFVVIDIPLPLEPVMAPLEPVMADERASEAEAKDELMREPVAVEDTTSEPFAETSVVETPSETEKPKRGKKAK